MLGAKWNNSFDCLGWLINQLALFNSSNGRKKFAPTKYDHFNQSKLRDELNCMMSQHQFHVAQLANCRPQLGNAKETVPLAFNSSNWWWWWYSFSGNMRMIIIVIQNDHVWSCKCFGCSCWINVGSAVAFAFEARTRSQLESSHVNQPTKLRNKCTPANLITHNLRPLSYFTTTTSNIEWPLTILTHLVASRISTSNY